MSSYKFTVRCENGTAKIVEWKTGDIDPGKEYLRLATGAGNPSCSVQDFNASTDAGLQTETKEGGSAIWDGLDPIKTIFGW